MKKLLYILIFFVCILASYFLTNSVFADNTNTFVFHNNIIDKDCTVVKPSSLPDDFIYSLVIVSFDTNSNKGDYNVNFFFSNTPLFIDTSSSVRWGIEFSSGEGLGVYHCSLSSRYYSSYDLSDKFNYFSFHASGFSSSSLLYTSSLPISISYSNYNVYDCNNNLLFQVAPVVEQITIPEIQSVEEIPQAMGEVMKIMIPIGLIIFGIGLLIYLIRLVISQVT